METNQKKAVKVEITPAHPVECELVTPEQMARCAVKTAPDYTASYAIARAYLDLLDMVRDGKAA